MGKRKTATERAIESLELKNHRAIVQMNSGSMPLTKQIFTSKQIKKREKEIEDLRSGRVKPKVTNFYQSREWLELRYRALVAHGRRCMCCGATPEDGVHMHVDHVKPRAKYPEAELDFDNLQVLCEACNLGKSSLDETDFRKTAPG